MNKPESLIEAIRYFSDPDTAQAYMVSKRWPDGVVCPICGSLDHYYLAKQRRWKCKNAHEKRQFSVKAGTIMEDSPLSLDKWLIATWMIVNAKNGISSYEIARGLGITQKSAWFLDHRIRHALQVGTFEKLSGTVEADESYVGGAVKNFKKSKLKELREKHKRPMGRQVNLGKHVKKTVVMGMLQRGEDGQPSQARMQLIDSAHGRYLHGVIRENVAPGSMLMTDSLKAYRGLRDEYVHATVNHAIEYVRGNVHTNGLENFWALMKRTLKGTYVAVEPFHMMRYLNEQCFRFNNRELTDGERFDIALAGIPGRRLTHAELTGQKPGGVICDGPVC